MALQFKPDYAEAQYNLGVVLQVCNRLDEAMQSYRRTIEMDPGMLRPTII